MKWPGRKDRDAAVADKDKAVKKGGDEQLLAEARKYEKAGDFTNASKKYREYLDGGGKPVNSSRDPVGPFAKSKKPTPDKLKSVASKDKEAKDKEADEKSPIKPAAKTKKTTPKDAQLAQTAEVEQDPWANLSVEESTRPVAKKASTPKPQISDEDETPSQTPAWADSETETPDTLATQTGRQSSRDLTEDDLEDLLDLDEGEIDWGEPSKSAKAKVAEVDSPAPEQVADVVESTENRSELPLVDLNTSDGDGLTAPAFAGTDEETESTETDSADHTWHSHAGSEEPNAELASLESEEASLPEEEFVPPVLDDVAAVDDVDSAAPQSLALTCQDCEPWLYAQVTKLESADPEVRKEGLVHLADLGSEARQAGLAVRTLLQDSDPLVQAHAAWALWVIENDPWDSVTTLRPLLDHSNPEVIELACYMLGDIGVHADSAVDPLELLRDHADGRTRVQAAEALIRIRGVDEKSLAVLTSALKSRSGEQRWVAAVALGHCRGPQSAKAVSALTSALKDVDPEVRSAAALSLGGLGSDAVKATSELERVARTDDAQVRDAARAALACLKQ